MAKTFCRACLTCSGFGAFNPCCRRINLCYNTFFGCQNISLYSICSQVSGIGFQLGFEPQKRAHSTQLAAGLASGSENSKLPYGRIFPVACCVEYSNFSAARKFKRYFVSRQKLTFEKYICCHCERSEAIPNYL